MGEWTHEEIVKKEKNGEILIGIEPAVARRFFTDTDHDLVIEQIEEPIPIERFSVKSVWILEHIFLLVGIITSVFALHWFSIIAIPSMFVSFYILGGKASMGAQRMGGSIFGLLIFLFLAYYLKQYGLWMVIWLIALPLPYFFARLTYKLSTIFLRMLAIRNPLLFNLYYDSGIFIKEL